MSVICFFGLVLFVLWVAFRKLSKQSGGLNQNKEIKHTSVSPLDLYTIQHQGIQLLESLYIIENTKNIDTLKGRIEFVLCTYNYFVNASQLDRYHADIDAIIEEYHLRYFDRHISEMQSILLVAPNNGDLLTYLSDSVYNCIRGYIVVQVEYARALKTQPAKQKRIDDMIEKAEQAISLYQTFELPDNSNIDMIRRIVPTTIK